MNINQFYIGMGTFEDLLDLATSGVSRELYLNICIETTPSSYPSFHFLKFSVVAARIAVDAGLCYYWRFPCGVTQDWGLDTTDERANAADKRLQSARNQLTAIAEEKAFVVIKALVATPKDMTFFDGTTVLLRYDKEANAFVRNYEIGEASV